MYHQRLHNVNSPLTPIPPMSQPSPFDFSPTAINHFLEASKSATPSALLRTYTPCLIELPPPDLSPIEYIPCSADRIAGGSPNPIVELNNSLSKGDEQISLDVGSDQQNCFNVSNINNRHLDINSVLAEIGLEQYRSLFDSNKIDLKTFLLLTDGDLQEIGVEDRIHRLAFMITIANWNGGFDYA